MENSKYTYFQVAETDRFENDIKKIASRKLFGKAFENDEIESDQDLFEIFKIKKDNDIPVEIVCHLQKDSLSMELMKDNPLEMIQGMIEVGMYINTNRGVFYVDSKEEEFFYEFFDFAQKRLKNLTSELGFEIRVERVEKYQYQGDISLLRRDDQQALYPFDEIKSMWDQNILVVKGETLVNATNNSSKERGFRYIALKDTKVEGIFKIRENTTINEILNGFGKGSKKDTEIMGVLIGGNTGSFIPKRFFDMDISADGIKSLGVSLGDFSIKAIHEDEDVDQILSDIIDKNVKMGCGNCAPGREGSYQIKKLFADKKYSEILNIAKVLKDTGLCNFCKEASNPIVSRIKFFE